MTNDEQSMTSDEARALDVRLAELLGLEVIDTPLAPAFVDANGYFTDQAAALWRATYPHGKVIRRVPHSSTDIAAAWQVVEHMKAQLWACTLTQLDMNEIGRKSFRMDTWICRLTGFDDEVEARADTAPLAICRAALEALEGNEK